MNYLYGFGISIGWGVFASLAAYSVSRCFDWDKGPFFPGYLTWAKGLFSQESVGPLSWHKILFLVVETFLVGMFFAALFGPALLSWWIWLILVILGSGCQLLYLHWEVRNL